MQYSRGKSALVFCSTRKGAQEAAQRLSQTAMTFGYSNPFIKSKEQLERLREASLSCSDKQMQSNILYGGRGLTSSSPCLNALIWWCGNKHLIFTVGYHNGGLCLKDRNLIESLFLKGDIQVICTTNTLAHGINLPAHTVIIKSTQHLYVQHLFLFWNFYPTHLISTLFMTHIVTRRRAFTWNMTGPPYYRFFIVTICFFPGSCFHLFFFFGDPTCLSEMRCNEY